MGDAVCGPSNPLQAFRKQTQADRSLQQDRLTARNNSAQGFRSSPGPNAGILDAEFEAFQRGGAVPPPELYGGPVHAPGGFQTLPVQPDMNASQQVNWANDFQRLHISPHPAVPPQQRQQVPQPSTANWHQEFSQINRSATPQYGPQASFQPQLGASFMNTHGPWQMSQPHMAQAQNGPLLNTAAQKGKERETFDDAAFEREFEMHAAQAEKQMLEEQRLQELKFDETVTRDMAANKSEIPESVKGAVLDDGLTEAQWRAAVDNSASLDLPRSAEQQGQRSRSHFDQVMDPLKEWAAAIHEDELRDTIEADSHVPAENRGAEENMSAERPAIDEDLARTAGELLSRVEEDNSDKFRNSEFLSLMRRMRDGEATIRHGQMQDSLASADTTKTIPPHEQDLDLGRDVRMAGALRSGATQAAQQNANDDSPAQNQQYSAEEYGRHTVDDF